MRIQDLDTFKVDEENFGSYGYYMLSENPSIFFKSVKIPCIGFTEDKFDIVYYQGMDEGGDFQIVRRILDHKTTSLHISHQWKSDGESYVNFIYDCKYTKGFDDEAVFELLYNPISLYDNSQNLH